MIHFGPAGNCSWFHEKYKSTYEMPKFLHEVGLNAYEIQCGRGVRMRDDVAATLKSEAEQYGISLSVHAPYYISLSGLEQETRLKSVDYILQSARLARKTGATRIVVHSGSCAKQTREEALEKAKDTLSKAVYALQEESLDDILICPEVMGKINQLGTLEEVMQLCSVDERMLPTVDFGHLNSRTEGSLTDRAAFAKVLDIMENALGIERARKFHSHFSKIEYTLDGGEKRHLTFEDSIYGPNFEPLLDELFHRQYTPTIICESADTMSRDALTMKKYFENLK